MWLVVVFVCSVFWSLHLLHSASHLGRLCFPTLTVVSTLVELRTAVPFLPSSPTNPCPNSPTKPHPRLHPASFLGSCPWSSDRPACLTGDAELGGREARARRHDHGFSLDFVTFVIERYAHTAAGARSWPWAICAFRCITRSLGRSVSQFALSRRAICVQSGGGSFLAICVSLSLPLCRALLLSPASNSPVHGPAHSSCIVHAWFCCVFFRLFAPFLRFCTSILSIPAFSFISLRTRRG